MPDLNLLVIKTGHLAEHAAFYTKLGFQFDYHRHGTGPYHYASIGGNVVLEIYPLPKGVYVADNTIRLGFKVSNLDNLIKELPEENILTSPVLTEWGYTAIIQDPDGRKIELVQP